MTATLEIIGVLMRWTHISSVVLALGGTAYARLILLPSLVALPPAERTGLLEQLLRRHRLLIYCVLPSLLVSGLYNLLSRRGHSPWYHAWFGVKMLLVAHLFTLALLLAHGPAGDPRRKRRMTGLAISGFCIVLLSAYLRRIY